MLMMLSKFRDAAIAFIDRHFAAVVLFVAALLLLLGFACSSSARASDEPPTMNAKLFCVDKSTVERASRMIAEDKAYERVNQFAKAAIEAGSCLMAPYPFTVPVLEEGPRVTFRDNDGDTMQVTWAKVRVGEAEYWTVLLLIVQES